MHWTKHEEDLEEVLPSYKELSSDEAKQRHFVGEREELVRKSKRGDSEWKGNRNLVSDHCNRSNLLQQKQFTATEAIY